MLTASPTRRFNRNSGSRAALEIAGKWLHECTNNGSETHPQCLVLRQHRPKHPPRRLIKITCTQGRLYLVLRRTATMESLQYSCLSYCWGGAQPVATTKETLSQHTEAIAFPSLPKTLRDAIIVTYQLGLSQIWIDSLCIVQVGTLPYPIAKLLTLSERPG
jgi:hypothetical protein